MLAHGSRIQNFAVVQILARGTENRKYAQLAVRMTGHAFDHEVAKPDETDNPDVD